MNKTELVEHMTEQADISKAVATRALQAAIKAIRTTRKHGEPVSLAGCSCFVTECPARKGRKGRNPRTKKEIQINACRAPKFRPGKALKDALN